MSVREVAWGETCALNEVANPRGMVLQVADAVLQPLHRGWGAGKGEAVAARQHRRSSSAWCLHVDTETLVPVAASNAFLQGQDLMTTLAPPARTRPRWILGERIRNMTSATVDTSTKPNVRWNSLPPRRVLDWIRAVGHAQARVLFASNQL